MGQQRFSMRQGWERATTGARLWWAAAGAIGLAMVVVLGAALVAPDGGATSAASPGATVTGSPGKAVSGNAGSGSGTGSGTGSGSGSGSGTGSMAMTPTPSSVSGTGSTGSTSTAALTVCPNVAGTTTMSNGMVMAPVPAAPPTAAQRAAADQLVAETTQALTRFASLSTAEAAGYVPATNPDGYVVHYADWQTVASGDVLDPNHPSSLVYANTVSGPVLLGAMYMGPAPCQPGPDVGGSLTQWHAHANLCLSASHQVVGQSSATGVCASGTHNTDTYFMLHVWTAPSLASTAQFQADLTKAEIAPIIRSGQG